MPLWRYVANRFLTFVENIFTGASSPNTTPATGPSHARFSNSYPSKPIPTILFLITRCWLKFFGIVTIAEVSCPTKYQAGSSSINFARSIDYGFGCLWTALVFRLAKMNLVKSKLFPR